MRGAALMGFDMTVSGPGATHAVHAVSWMTATHLMTELTHAHMNGALRSSVSRGLSTSQSRAGCAHGAL